MPRISEGDIVDATGYILDVEMFDHNVDQGRDRKDMNPVSTENYKLNDKTMVYLFFIIISTKNFFSDRSIPSSLTKAMGRESVPLEF